MRKSFKTLDVGYSTELESSLFQGFENNDEYIKDRIDNCSKYLYIYQHTGSIKWSGTDDSSARNMIHVSPKLIFKNDYVYFMSLSIRTLTVTQVSNPWTYGLFYMSSSFETAPEGYTGWSGGLTIEQYVNDRGYYNGLQNSGFIYVRGGTEDFEQSITLETSSWCTFGDNFSGEIDSYVGSPVELTIKELGPLRLWY